MGGLEYSEMILGPYENITFLRPDPLMATTRVKAMATLMAKASLTAITTATAMAIAMGTAMARARQWQR